MRQHEKSTSIFPAVATLAVGITLISLLTGCSAMAPFGEPTSPVQPALGSFHFPLTPEDAPLGLFAPSARPDETADDEGDEAEEEPSSTLGTVLLYIPNRIIDLLDTIRFGVNVGAGIGVDVRCTKWGKLTLISDTSAGIGYQTLRHLPVCLRSQSKIGLAFLSTPGWDLLGWYEADYDLRLELFVLLVGAHAAVDLGEVLDFVGGIFTWDPMEDDFRADI